MKKITKVLSLAFLLGGLTLSATSCDTNGGEKVANVKTAVKVLDAASQTTGEVYKQKISNSEYFAFTSKSFARASQTVIEANSTSKADASQTIEYQFLLNTAPIKTVLNGETPAEDAIFVEAAYMKNESNRSSDNNSVTRLIENGIYDNVGYSLYKTPTSEQKYKYDGINNDIASEVISIIQQVSNINSDNISGIIGDIVGDDTTIGDIDLSKVKTLYTALGEETIKWLEEETTTESYVDTVATAIFDSTSSEYQSYFLAYKPQIIATADLVRTGLNKLVTIKGTSNGFSLHSDTKSMKNFLNSIVDFATAESKKESATASEASFYIAVASNLTKVIPEIPTYSCDLSFKFDSAALVGFTYNISSTIDTVSDSYTSHTVNESNGEFEVLFKKISVKTMSDLDTYKEYNA